MRIAWPSVVLVLALVLAPAAATHADDWLAVLPACDATLARDVGPVFELVYPRPGLPALVEAGQTLIARVRLPSPLTPPPGVQQQRALRGFGAELIGHARAFGAATNAVQPLEHRYPLEVVNVRPDGAASLVYRVSLPIPAWVAPGTYDLMLSAPGGSGRALSLLRVLAQGEAPRVAWVIGGDVPPTAAAAALPFDVWVRPDDGVEPALGSDEVRDDARAPLLAPRSLSAALRIADGLWVIGGCDSPHWPFVDEVASVVARESRVRLDVTPPTIATSRGFVAWDRAARFQAWPPEDAVRFEADATDADRVRIAAIGALPRAEFTLLFASDGRAVEASAGTLRFFPASEIARVAPPALIVQLRVSGVDDVRVQRAPRSATAAPSLVATPLDPQSGDVVRVRAVAPSPLGRVAYRFDAQHTAFTAFSAQEAQHVYQTLGPQRIEALALAADGVAHRIQTSVRVKTAQRTGCRCQLTSIATVPPGWSWWAAAAVLALRAGQVRARRNRARKAP